MTFACTQALRVSTLIICCSLLSLFALAQPMRRDSISWSEFVEAYFGEDESTDEVESNERLSLYDLLEELHASPLNINTCSREDLMLLPFINGYKADAIIAYRDKRGLLSMGELLLIPSLTYTDRLYLPLFAYVGERDTLRPTTLQQLTRGKYEVETRLDIPLYKREGNRPHTRSELERYPNRIYYGNGLTNELRFRYKYGRTWAYGLTFEKDAGEPFAAEGNIPYDYVSFYVHHRTKLSEWIFGDYEIRTGQGLLFGNGFSLGKTMLVSSAVQSGLRLKAHTATEENKFFRGIAFRRRFGHFETAAFASWRTLDASFSNDTIQTLQTSGLHRTASELDRKDQATSLTAGARLGYNVINASIGLTAFATHFTQTVYPPLRYYNSTYFRGKTVSGFALDYAWQNERWDIGGELATDHKLHVAYSGQIRFRANDDLLFFLQHRHLAAHFISFYGHISQEGSRCANEHGALLGTVARVWKGTTLTAYADFFILPRPTYLNHQRTRGIDFYLRADFKPSYNKAWQFLYRFKSKERGISGRADLCQFVQTHRASIRLTQSLGKLTLYPTLTACLRQPQVGDAAWGWMAALRATWQPSQKYKVAAFASVFMSDDSQSALYAYEPQLVYQGGFPSFYFHGMRLALTATINLFGGLEGGIKIGSTHYFNRDKISSSTQLIRSPWKNDLSLQLRWRFQPKRNKSHQ